jgi:hypothetical protein
MKNILHTFKGKCGSVEVWTLGIKCLGTVFCSFPIMRFKGPIHIDIKLDLIKQGLKTSKNDLIAELVLEIMRESHPEFKMDGNAIQALHKEVEKSFIL